MRTCVVSFDCHKITTSSSYFQTHVPGPLSQSDDSLCRFRTFSKLPAHGYRVASTPTHFTATSITFSFVSPCFALFDLLKCWELLEDSTTTHVYPENGELPRRYPTIRLSSIRMATWYQHQLTSSKQLLKLDSYLVTCLLKAVNLHPDTASSMIDHFPATGLLQELSVIST